MPTRKLKTGFVSGVRTGRCASPAQRDHEQKKRTVRWWVRTARMGGVRFLPWVGQAFLPVNRPKV